MYRKKNGKNENNKKKNIRGEICGWREIKERVTEYKNNSDFVNTCLYPTSFFF